MDISFSVFKLWMSFLSILKSTHCSKAPPNVQCFLQKLNAFWAQLVWNQNLCYRVDILMHHYYFHCHLKMSILAQNPPGRVSQGFKRLQSIPIQYLLVKIGNRDYTLLPCHLVFPVKSTRQVHTKWAARALDQAEEVHPDRKCLLSALSGAAAVSLELKCLLNIKLAS